MTIGPAPMIRMVEISVRFGIMSLVFRHKKRARHSRVPWAGAGARPRASGSLDQIRSGGNVGCGAPSAGRPALRLAVPLVVLVSRRREPYGARPNIGDGNGYWYREVVQPDKRIWVHSAFWRRQGRVCSHLGRLAGGPQLAQRGTN